MSETGPHLITDDDTSSSTSAASASSSEPTSHTTTQVKKEPLPLGWTQVTRKRKTPDSDTNDDNDKNHHWWNCTDPNCERPPPSFATQTKTLKLNSSKDPDSELVLHGTAIFCLPDLNPSWMQGYLFPTGSKKPYRLLAVQDHDLDECLQCADGGYRQVSLTVIGSNKTKQKRRHAIPKIDWTGGDMMRWTTPDGSVHLEPHQLATDQKAIPYVRKYFQALVDQVASKVSSCTDENDKDDDDDEPSKASPSSSSSCNDDTVADILEVLPQVAIVTGTMTVRLPIQNEGDE